MLCSMMYPPPRITYLDTTPSNSFTISYLQHPLFFLCTFLLVSFVSSHPFSFPLTSSKLSILCSKLALKHNKIFDMRRYVGIPDFTPTHTLHVKFPTTTSQSGVECGSGNLLSLDTTLNPPSGVWWEGPALPEEESFTLLELDLVCEWGEAGKRQGRGRGEAGKR